jgi:hypothetical protein
MWLVQLWFYGCFFCTPRDVSGPWMKAIEARDVRAIEAKLALPFDIYYDDNWTGKRPAECDPVRVVRRIETAAERTRVATCIARTVRVSGVAQASEPIGIWTFARLEPHLPTPMRGVMKTLSSDHVFVRLPSIASGDYDIAIAVPKQGEPEARAVVLTTING